MNVDDLSVEVRNKTLDRVGQLSGADLVGAEFILRHNEVGSWKVKLHATSAMAELLRTPGYGLIVTGPDGVILSGPMLSAALAQTDNEPEGTWVIEGADDSVILSEKLSYPYPASADVTAQLASHDIREDVAETVLKGYVNANLVTGPTVRRVNTLTVATDDGRGETVYGSARFENMQEFFYNLAQSGGVGYSLQQEGSNLVFDVYEPVDRSALIRFDIDTGRLTSANYSYSAPLLTRAIIGGAGEQEERLFFEGTSSDSTAAETVWGRRIESFVDARTTQLEAEFDQEATTALVDNGKTRVAMTVTPADNTTMLFGSEWGLGDTVTVTVRDIVATAVVYTVALSIQTDGVYLAAEVGTPVASSYEAMLSQATVSQGQRIGQIERNNTGYGVVTTFAGVEGGTSGTQPTFSGDVFTATYTRFGDMIHFAYTVDFDTITNFGTGQYYMTLPYNARRDYSFREGRLLDVSQSLQFHIAGTVSAGDNVMYLWTTDRQGNRIYDSPFEHDDPVTLTTSDSFTIAGTYELEQ